MRCGWCGAKNVALMDNDPCQLKSHHKPGDINKRACIGPEETYAHLIDMEGNSVMD